MTITATRLKRFAAGAAVTCSVVGLVGAPPAAAAVAWPPVQPECGTDADGGNLWNRVNGAPQTDTPDKVGNKVVVWPNDKKELGYAVHNGSQGGTEPWNLLLVPTVRISGIECPSLLANGAPEFFKYAESQQGLLPNGGGDWGFGINAMTDRSENQMHIHMSRIVPDLHAEIDKQYAAFAPDQSKWFDSHITIKGRTYRAWNASDLNHNFFSRLFEDVVKKAGSKVHMSDETMVVTENLMGPGYLVLNSDKVSGLPNGTDNSDFMLDRFAK